MAKHNSGKHYVDLARENGLTVEPGKGDHMKIRGPAGRGYMIVPLHRELANGTESAIRKWFKAAGIIIPILAAIIYANFM